MVDELWEERQLRKFLVDGIRLDSEMKKGSIKKVSILLESPVGGIFCSCRQKFYVMQTVL